MTRWGRALAALGSYAALVLTGAAIVAMAQPVVRDCSGGCLLVSDPAPAADRASIASCRLYEGPILRDDQALDANGACRFTRVVPPGATRQFTARWHLLDGSESEDSNPLLITSLQPPANFRLEP